MASKRKKKRSKAPRPRVVPPGHAPKRSPEASGARQTQADTRGVAAKPLASVIIPVLDRLEYTALCIESLLEHTSPEKFELIIVDNGSGPKTVEYLRSLSEELVDTPDVSMLGPPPEHTNGKTPHNDPKAAGDDAPAPENSDAVRGGAAVAHGNLQAAGSEASTHGGSASRTPQAAPDAANHDRGGPTVKIVRFDENRGIAPAWNAGVRESRGDYLVFADNDVLFTQGWLEGILRGFCDETVWAVVPNLSHMFVPRDFGRRAPDMLAQPLMTSNESLVGTFFVIPRQVIETLGPFDEEFGIGPYADLDFEFRLLSSEKRTVEVTNVCIHHFEGRTVTQLPGFFEECEERSRTYFDRKWRMPAPMPPMSADFEFQMWLSKVRALPEPDPDEIRRRAGYDPRDWPDRRPRIIACINVFNDIHALPNCLASIEGVDKICFVDGAYATVKHDVPYSTDGTLEYINQLAAEDERVHVIACTEAWKDEATKRSAYFIGSDGDWYLQLDADEQLIDDAFQVGAGLDPLRRHLSVCRLDAHFLPIYEPATRMKLVLPRVFRHQDGIRYDAAHWNVVAGDIPIAPDWSAPLPLHGVAVLHNREQRDRQRVRVQDAYYKTMYASEAEEFGRRVADIEARLTGDPEQDAKDLELIWMYKTHVIYQQQYHEAALRGQFGHGS